MPAAYDDLQTVLELPGQSLARNATVGTAVPIRPQRFCGDSEGWGPISWRRYDFTPCFLDIGIVFIAVWGLVMGSGALWMLFKRRTPQPVGKNWHFYAKLVCALPFYCGIFFLYAFSNDLCGGWVVDSLRRDARDRTPGLFTDRGVPWRFLRRLSILEHDPSVGFVGRHICGPIL